MSSIFGWLLLISLYIARKKIIYIISSTIGWLWLISLYNLDFCNKDPKSDVSCHSKLEWICCHLKLDVSCLPKLEWICCHPKLGILCFPNWNEFVVIQNWMFLVFQNWNGPPVPALIRFSSQGQCPGQLWFGLVAWVGARASFDLV